MTPVVTLLIIMAAVTVVAWLLLAWLRWLPRWREAARVIRGAEAEERAGGGPSLPAVGSRPTGTGWPTAGMEHVADGRREITLRRWGRNDV